ncbi:MAG TPA: SUMF1/EgtB/PvdO family nonheme iron enzyme [Terrimicrobiaceae bacterium]|nr:SUMF1/EgtB/PvdO family nonheme iron enzyme [Terrimicrobiaceae bacterium]
MNSLLPRSLAVVFSLMTPIALAEGPPGMVWVPGGEFVMGTDDKKSMPNERPAHRVYVDGFWMDATIVTNAEFAQFVEATGYKTVAERPGRLGRAQKTSSARNTEAAGRNAATRLPGLHSARSPR